MAIQSLSITNFRNLAAVDLVPCSPGLNIISGVNGSGKTSLLESIYYLGHGRSFRSAVSTNLVRHGAEKISIIAQALRDNQYGVPMGLERSIKNSALRLRIAEKDVSSIAELALLLPIRVINSQSHHLFESGPHYRRKYLDWGLFYQADDFFSCWQHFERALKQRNVILRDKRPKRELDPWTDELIKHGLKLDKIRRTYIQQLMPIIIDTAQELLTIPQINISYYPGWNENTDLASVLAASYASEFRFGSTQFGPHRADLEIQINMVAAKHFLSRGQQKLLICAMILAQGILLTRNVKKGLIYLVDDLPSELDSSGRKKLVSLLSRQDTQVFITAIEGETIRHLISDQPDTPVKLFHVEHGSVTEVERA